MNHLFQSRSLLRFPGLILALGLWCSGPAEGAGFEDGDDFNDNLKSIAKWGAFDQGSGLARYNELNERLEYTTLVGTPNDHRRRLWELNQGSYNEDWSVTLTVHVDDFPGLFSNQDLFMGLEIWNAADGSDLMSVELLVENPGSGPQKVFRSRFTANGAGSPVLSAPASATDVTLRLRWEAVTTVLHAEYDPTGPEDGPDWVTLSSQDLGVGSTESWGMSAFSNFRAGISARSVNMTVASGSVYADDFGAGEPLNPIPPSRPVTLSGLTNGLTVINPAVISMMAASTNVPGDDTVLSIEYSSEPYVNGTRIFGRPFDLTEYGMPFNWTNPPLGRHWIWAQVVDNFFSPSQTNVSEAFEVIVEGSPLGFSRLTNLVTVPFPQQVDQDTLFGAQLEVRNGTALSTLPLRVRLLLTQTFYYQSTTPMPPVVPFVETNFVFQVLHPPLEPSQSFLVTIETNENLICPRFERAENEESGFQFHVDAVLEEQVGASWLMIDRARIVSSYPDLVFPYNDGAPGIDPLPNTNLFAFLTSLEILGATNVMGGNQETYVARAVLSDNTSGSVMPEWMVTDYSIDQGGVLSTSDPGGDMPVPVTVTATFRRSIVSLTATKDISILPLVPPPVIITEPVDQTVPVGGAAWMSVAASADGTLSYQWYFNDTLVPGATSRDYFIDPATVDAAGRYRVVVGNGSGSVTSRDAILAILDPGMNLTSELLSADTLQLRLDVVPGYDYFIDASTNLIHWETWTNYPSPSGSILFIVNPLSAPGARFFRARRER